MSIKLITLEQLIGYNKVVKSEITFITKEGTPLVTKKYDELTSEEKNKLRVRFIEYMPMKDKYKVYAM